MPCPRLLAGLLLAAPLLAQADAPVVRLHDLRALESLALPGDFGVDLRLPLTSSYLDSLESDYGDGPQVPLEDALDFDGDQWIGLLSDVLEAEGVTELYEIEPRAGFLRIEASPAVHARIEGLLVAFEHALLRTVELDAFQLPQGLPKDLGPLLDATQAAALLAAYPPVDGARARVALGQRARLGSRRWQAELVDFDVEVAEMASTSDPQVTRLLDGLELGAIVHALPGGDLFLRTWSRQTQPAGEPRRVRIDDQRDLWVRLPSQASSLTTGAAVLEPGGALLIGHDRHPGGMLLVRARLEAPGPEAGAFVPLGALLAPPLIPRLPTVWGPAPSGGLYHESPVDELRETLGQRLFDDAWHLEDHLREDLDRAGLEGLVRVVGPVAYAPDPQARERVRGNVQEWAAAATRTVTLDLRFGLVPREVALRAQTGATTFAELLPQLAWRAAGACRPGDALMVVGGEERYYLQDYDVEIAKEAVIGDPVVNEVFDGFTFWCRPSGARGGRIVAWTDLVLVRTLDGSVSATVAWENGPRQEGRDPIIVHGPLELPLASRATLRATVSLQQGEWTLLETTGLQGTDQALVALLRAQVRD